MIWEKMIMMSMKMMMILVPRLFNTSYSMASPPRSPHPQSISLPRFENIVIILKIAISTTTKIHQMSMK